MAINKNSNAYIIIYTVVMVVIVGALLAFLATSLKDKQAANVLNEQKTSIMKAFGDENASFDEVVTVGRLTDGVFTPIAKDAKADIDKVFKLLSKRKELADAEKDLPIFKYEKDSVTKYVLPLVGKGLWGDIWGYVSLQQVEGNVVITGIVMDHAGETPGLGAEIASLGVQNEFVGKKLYNEKNEIAVKMLKGGKENKEYLEGHSVDAITGGTKTCDGVNKMLETSIGKYTSFLLASEPVQEPGVASDDMRDVACNKPECCTVNCEECENHKECCTVNCEECDKRNECCSEKCKECDKRNECCSEKCNECDKRKECCSENCEETCQEQCKSCCKAKDNVELTK